MNFSEFGFDSRIAAGVKACGYQTPTPIQAQAIPPAIQGSDIMGLAQTGTGKTAAFALPIMQRLLSGPRGTLRALVVAPTRELAEQICDCFKTLGRDTRLTVTTVYGGVGIRPQVQALRRGVDIVVACPGRLLDHAKQGTINLRNIQMVVLDEADMMLDMGFLPDVRRILEKLPAKRQNMMFSATMPDAIRILSKDILHSPVVAKVNHSRPVDTVAHALYPVAQNMKTPLLIELLSKTDSESVLIFTRTKHRAKKLGTLLVQQGHKATSLQGNLSQAKRQAALDGFRRGRYSILVATDIAARGIDVTQVSHVINYDLPDTVDAYTHRIGRTGRASRSGDAFSLVTREDNSVIRQIENVLGSSIERRTLEGFDYKNAEIPKSEPSSTPSRPGNRSQRQGDRPRSADRPRGGDGLRRTRESHPRSGAPARSTQPGPQSRDGSSRNRPVRPGGTRSRFGSGQDRPSGGFRHHGGGHAQGARGARPQGARQHTHREPGLQPAWSRSYYDDEA